MAIEGRSTNLATDLRGHEHAVDTCDDDVAEVWESLLAGVARTQMARRSGSGSTGLRQSTRSRGASAVILTSTIDPSGEQTRANPPWSGHYRAASDEHMRHRKRAREQEEAKSVNGTGRTFQPPNRMDAKSMI
jgi:hypothetical protein